MRGKSKRKNLVGIVILILTISSIIQVQPTLQKLPYAYFYLYAKIPSDSYGVDYFNLIKQQLRFIGIDLKITIQDPFVWQNELMTFRNFDLTIIEINQTEFDPYLTNYYSENGIYNVFGYDTSMDWDDELQTGRNEWYMQNGSILYPLNSTESISLNWEWQQYLISEIQPAVPLFSENNDSFSMLAFNLRENRKHIGNKDPCPGSKEKTIGLAIRKAIAYAINREEINKIVHKSEMEITHWPILPKWNEWCNPSITKSCYNLDIAKQLMATAGFWEVVCWDKCPPRPRWPKLDKACPQYKTNSLSISKFMIICAFASLIILTIRRIKWRINR
ncbi:MAG: hypothetical protein HZR80_10830 [Candidatus Heimdallarchaeota archaeon]